MLQQIKDTSQYVGRKVVFWDCDLRRRPRRCRIVEYVVKYTHGEKKDKENHALITTFASEESFTLEDAHGYRVYNVKRCHLWKNFTEVYKYIVENCSYSTLCNPDAYSYAEDEAICQLNKMRSSIEVLIGERPGASATFERELERLKCSLQNSLDMVNKLTKPLVREKELIENSCWGFILDLRRKRPDIRVRYRGGEISAATLALTKN